MKHGWIAVALSIALAGCASEGAEPKVPSPVSPTDRSPTPTVQDIMDGLGVVAAFSTLGFDADLFKNPPDGRRLISRVTTFPATGELAARVSRHTEAHQRPNADDWMKSIQAVPRTDSGVHLPARPDQAASEDRGSRRSWVRRLVG